MPELLAGFEYYDMTREEKMELWWKRIYALKSSKYGREFFEDCDKDKFGGWSVLLNGVSPLSVHTGMFC